VFKPGYRLRSKISDKVYVEGTVCDATFERVRGKSAHWRVEGTGSFVIHRMVNTSILFVDGRAREVDFKHGRTLKKPVKIRPGVVVGFDDNVVCSRCRRPHDNVTFGVCQACVELYELRPCELCGRWIDRDGPSLCDVCEGRGRKTYVPWVQDAHRCQFGLDFEGFKNECGVMEVCFNCPFLPYALKGQKLKLTQSNGAITAVSDMYRVVICSEGHCGINEKTFLKMLMTKLAYLTSHGLLETQPMSEVKGMLEAAKKYYEDVWSVSLSAGAAMMAMNRQTTSSLLASMNRQKRANRRSKLQNYQKKKRRGSP